MNEDLGAWLKAKWDEQKSWDYLGDLVGIRLQESFQAGVTAYKREQGIKALKGLLEALTDKD